MREPLIGWRCERVEVRWQGKTGLGKCVVFVVHD